MNKKITEVKKVQDITLLSIKDTKNYIKNILNQDLEYKYKNTYNIFIFLLGNNKEEMTKNELKKILVEFEKGISDKEFEVLCKELSFTDDIYSKITIKEFLDKMYSK